MTLKPLLLGLLLALPVHAEEAELHELLRDALYTEEVTRDPDAAAKQYEELLAKHDAERPFAAAALFRLAEVRRKQDRKDEAIALYQRLLTRFPEAAAEGKLAKENLAALGAKAADQALVIDDFEEREIQKLTALKKSSPDQISDPQRLTQAISNDHEKLVEFLLSHGADPKSPGALPFAVDRGNLAICKLLLQHGKPEPEESGKALTSAISKDRQAILDYLLEQGVDPDAPFPHADGPHLSPLMFAVDEGKPESAAKLLDHGAEIDFMGSIGTALHLAVQRDAGLSLFRLLLERGANPDLPTPNVGLTPLHLATAADGPDSVTMVRELLAKGADPNRKSTVTVDPTTSDATRKLLNHATPIGIAFEAGSVAKVEAMLSTGASPDTLDREGTPLLTKAVVSRSAELFQLLLKAGADVDKKDKARNPPLLHAISNADVEMAKALLEAGAQPSTGAYPNTALVLAGSGRAATELVPLLREHGALMSKEWIDDGFTGAFPAILPKLIEQHTIPRFLGKRSISMIVTGFGRFEAVELQAEQPDAKPRSLELLLLDQKDMKWPCFGTLSPQDPVVWPTRFHIWRHGNLGELEKISGRFNQAAPFPPLEWGDIVELFPDPKALEAAKSRYRLGPHIRRDSGLSAEIAWSLRKRVEFPVTVITDGKSRNFTMQGRRFLFDPTKTEIPWVGASQLAGVLWQPDVKPPRSEMPTLTVIRTGWPEIRVPWGQQGHQDFELELGDTLRVTTSSWKDDGHIQRKSRVVIRGQGVPFQLEFGESFDGRLLEPSIPTLIQGLAQLVASPPIVSDKSTNSEKLAVQLSNSGFAPTPILPHPDFSKIRIRRLAEDGSESVIHVDLAKTISEAGDTVTPEQARKTDMKLQPGDIVEIPVSGTSFGPPWKGPGIQEQNFFAKALDCRLQIIDQSGKIELRDVAYRAHPFVRVEEDWIPLPPEHGTPSLLASAALGLNGPVTVTRDGIEAGTVEAYRCFVRDGDILRISGQGRPPRQRVLPPTPSR